LFLFDRPFVTILVSGFVDVDVDVDGVGVGSDCDCGNDDDDDDDDDDGDRFAACLMTRIEMFIEREGGRNIWRWHVGYRSKPSGVPMKSMLSFFDC
jgi:hypothetical protein